MSRLRTPEYRNLVKGTEDGSLDVTLRAQVMGIEIEHYLGLALADRPERATLIALLSPAIRDAHEREFAWKPTPPILTHEHWQDSLLATLAIFDELAWEPSLISADRPSPREGFEADVRHLLTCTDDLSNPRVIQRYGLIIAGLMVVAMSSRVEINEAKARRKAGLPKGEIRALETLRTLLM